MKDTTRSPQLTQKLAHAEPAAQQQTLREVEHADLLAILGGSVGSYIPPGGCVPSAIGDRIFLDYLKQLGVPAPQQPLMVV